MSTTTTAASTNASAEGSRARLHRIAAVALRDLRGEARGFLVFVFCIALGVAAISVVGALRDALSAGFAREGRVLLGGDIAVSRIHQRADPDERALLAGLGRLSEVASMRAMVRRPGNEAAGRLRRAATLVEIKAVDGRYPLVGRVHLVGEPGHAGGTGAMGRLREGPFALADPILLERLGLAVGDKLALGAIDITIAGRIASEPDRFAGRATFGPRLMVSLETLLATGLVQPGSLVRWRYRVLAAAPGTADGGGLAPDRAISRITARLKRRLGPLGYQIRARSNPAPGLRRGIEQFGQFLTLVALTAMMIGGIGVANAVTSYLDRKRKVIAAFRSVGATNAMIRRIYLAEVLIVAIAGVVIGLALGYGVLAFAAARVAGALPVGLEVVVEPATVATAAAYGLLTALLFALWPIGRAERAGPAALFRDQVEDPRAWPRRGMIAASALTMAALVVLTIARSGEPLFALYFSLGLALLFGLCFGYGWLLRLAPRWLARPRRVELSLALGNMSGPGALTRSIVLSLGIGLTLLVTVTLANRSLVAEFETRVPDRAPSYYFLDIPKSAIGRFEETLRRVVPDLIVADAPMLRGRLLKLAGRPASEVDVPMRSRWVLRGDRGLSFSKDVPAGSKVVAGKWWPPDYDGPALVSMEREIADDLGLGIGDSVTVNILGRAVSARIASLREVKWGSLAINFVLVFSPDTLSAAPFNMLATARFGTQPSLATEARLIEAVAAAYPGVSALRVRDAIDAFNAIFRRVMLAIRIAGGVTLLAGAIVLAGALATVERARIYQAVILKALGATRRRIMTASAIEYLILALATSALAVGLGTLAAWLIVTRVMEADFAFSAQAVLEVVGFAIALVLTFGAIGSWRVLRAPARTFLHPE